MIQRLLLASHGSTGSIAAELVAIHSCKAGDEIDHLYVIPSWWGDMTGDDWLNNGVSRNRFRDYLADTLWQESQAVITRVQRSCQNKSIKYRSLLLVGKSDQSLAKTAESGDYQKIVLGDKRPAHSQGLSDRMLTPEVRKRLDSKLCIVTHPDEP